VLLFVLDELGDIDLVDVTCAQKAHHLIFIDFALVFYGKKVLQLMYHLKFFLTG
jgi:hypothetical protein